MRSFGTTTDSRTFVPPPESPSSPTLRSQASSIGRQASQSCPAKSRNRHGRVGQPSCACGCRSADFGCPVRRSRQGLCAARRDRLRHDDYSSRPAGRVPSVIPCRVPWTRSARFAGPRPAGLPGQRLVTATRRVPTNGQVAADAAGAAPHAVRRSSAVISRRHPTGSWCAPSRPAAPASPWRGSRPARDPRPALLTTACPRPRSA